MKECGVKLIGGHLDCSKLSDEQCILLANENVPEGRFAAAAKVFESYSTDLLEIYARAHSQGGQWTDRCTGSEAVYQAAMAELARRRG